MSDEFYQCIWCSGRRSAGHQIQIGEKVLYVHQPCFERERYHYLTQAHSSVRKAIGRPITGVYAKLVTEAKAAGVEIRLGLSPKGQRKQARVERRRARVYAEQEGKV